MITPAQHRLLSVIHHQVTTFGIAPSFREMVAAMGCGSKSHIFEILEGLEERGFIRRLRNRNRAIEILKLPPSFGGACPTCGRSAPSARASLATAPSQAGGLPEIFAPGRPPITAEEER